MKITTAIQGYWLDRELNFAKSTVAGYRVFYRHMTEYLGDVEIEAITPRDIRQFLLYMANEKGWSRRSVYDCWIALSSLWTWAETELKIEHVIRGHVPAPKFTKKIAQTFSQDEIKALIAAAESSDEWRHQSGKTIRTKRPTALRDVAIIYILLDSGIRNGELCRLKIRDYDGARGRLFIEQAKHDKQRFVVLGKRSRKALWRYLSTRPSARPDEALLAVRSTDHIDRNNLRHMLNKIGERANVKCHPHKFRHTFAINFLRNGGNILVLQELLGHSSLTMVKHYAAIAEQDIDSAADYSVADRWRI